MTTPQTLQTIFYCSALLLLFWQLAKDTTDIFKQWFNEIRK